MWTYDKALSVARAYVEGVTDGRGVVVENQTLDRPYGWVFFYQSREFLESGNTLDAFGGNAPIIFNRLSGEYRVTGTAHPLEHYLQEYEATLAPITLQMKPQLRQRSGAG
jgi:hypothetical protein